MLTSASRGLSSLTLSQGTHKYQTLFVCLFSDISDLGAHPSSGSCKSCGHVPSMEKLKTWFYCSCWKKKIEKMPTSTFRLPRRS